MSTTRTATATSVALACPPVHKRALGMALGLVAGICVFLLTVFHIGIHATGQGLNVGLLSQYFYGYEVSWTGAVVGFGWACVTGFVLGWFLAFVRNLVVTTAAFALMSQEEMAHTRRFLDHI